MKQRFSLILISGLVLMAASAGSAQTFSFEQLDTVIYYQNPDTAYEFHGHVSNLVNDTRFLRYTMTPVAISDTARQTSICTFVGCYAYRSGVNIVDQDYEPLQDDPNVKFYIYNLISDWSQGFPMSVPSPLVGDYTYDVNVTSVAVPSESITYRIHLIFGESVVSEIVTQIPSSPSLITNFPNPFNASTQIQFTIQRPGVVNLAVFDVLGRQVASLIEMRALQAGSFTVDWNAASSATPVASGNYIVRLDSPGSVATGRITLIR